MSVVWIKILALEMKISVRRYSEVEVTEIGNILSVMKK